MHTVSLAVIFFHNLSENIVPSEYYRLQIKRKWWRENEDMQEQEQQSRRKMKKEKVRKRERKLI